MLALGRELGREARVEVRLGVRVDPPLPALDEIDDVQELALVAPQVDRFERAGARDSGPTELDGIDVGPQRAVRPQSSQPADAPACRRAPDVLDADPDPERVALFRMLDGPAPGLGVLERQPQLRSAKAVEVAGAGEQGDRRSQERRDSARPDGDGAPVDGEESARQRYGLQASASWKPCFSSSELSWIAFTVFDVLVANAWIAGANGKSSWAS